MFRLLAGLAVAAAMLMLAEAVLRGLLGPPPPPVTVLHRRGQVDHYIEIHGETAEAAYQVLEPIGPFALRSAGPRIAVLGGSSVHVGGGGLPVAAEAASRLAEALDIEVLNLGMPGLDSHDLVEIVGELAPAGLDALVVYTGHNDLGNTLFQGRYTGRLGDAEARVLSALEHLQIFCQLRRAVAATEGHTEEETGGPQMQMTAAQRDAAIRYFAANMRRIVWLAQRQGRPLVLVVPASDLTRRPSHRCPEPPCAAALWEQARQTGDADYLRQARDRDVVAIRAPSAVEDIVRSLAGEPGVTVVDAAAELPRDARFDAPDRRLFIDPVHFSERGNQALADLLAPAVREVLAEE